MGFIMAVNLSVKNVPEALAAKLRGRAERNHRSLQGELMAILEIAASEPQVGRANGPDFAYEVGAAPRADGLIERLTAIAGGRGIDTTKRLTREQAHNRKLLRKSGV
jgi:plasmid stability protein